MPRRALRLALAILLLLGLADAAVWYLATARMERALAAWTAARRAQGWRIAYGTPRRAGLPFAAALVLPDFLASPPGPLGLPGPGGIHRGRVVWRAARLTLRLPPLLPPRLTADAGGAQSLQVAAATPVPFAAARARLTLGLSWRGHIRSAALAIADLRGAPEGRAAGLAVTRARLSLTPAPRNRLALALDISDVVLPRGRVWPLGPRIASVTAQGSATAPPRGGNARTRLARWQQAGGDLRLDRADLRWGSLDLSLAARLGLDPALRLEGTGRATIAGYAPALDTLAANGAVPDGAAVAAKAVLSLLADGSDKPLTIPLTLHDGRLSMDGLPLLVLAPLAPGGK